MSRSTYLFLIALLALPVIALAAKAGFLARDTNLRERPNPLASVVANASAHAPLAVLERRGYWLHVKLQETGEEGWVRSIRVRYQTSVQGSTSGSARGSRSASDNAQSSGGFFASLARGATSLVGGDSATSSRKTETTTIGIRGLGPEELMTAKPDPAAVRGMDENRSTPHRAEAFAKAADLSAHDVSYTQE